MYPRNLLSRPFCTLTPDLTDEAYPYRSIEGERLSSTFRGSANEDRGSDKVTVRLCIVEYETRGMIVRAKRTRIEVVLIVVS